MVSETNLAQQQVHQRAEKCHVCGTVFDRKFCVALLCFVATSNRMFSHLNRTVYINIHHSHGCLRYIQSRHGRTRQYPLRLLFHIVRVCLCRQQSHSECVDNVRLFLIDWWSGHIGDWGYARGGAAKSKSKCDMIECTAQIWKSNFPFLGTRAQDRAVAVGVWHIYHYAIHGIPILCHCERSDFRVQHSDGFDVDTIVGRMCLQLANHLFVICGIGRFDEIGGSGPFESKSRDSDDDNRSFLGGGYQQIFRNKKFSQNVSTLSL